VAAAFLGDDALKPELADLLPQRFSISVAGSRRPVVAVEGEVFEEPAAFPVGPAVNGSAVDREHVEDDQHHLDPPLAVKHPLAQSRKAGQAIIAERDQLAIDR
jgi:hypothetical protein